MQREDVNTSMPERIWITGESCLWPTFRQFHASDLDHSNDDGTCDYPEYVRADALRALLDRAEKAEAELAELTKAHDTVCGVAAVAGEAALARPSAPETLAWAVLGEDGKVVPGELYAIRGCADEIAQHHGERVVRVAIRVVPD